MSSQTYLNPNNPAKFVQDSPRLGNQYLEDSAFIDVLKRVLPAGVLSEIEPDLIRWFVCGVSDTCCCCYMVFVVGQVFVEWGLLLFVHGSLLGLTGVLGATE